MLNRDYRHLQVKEVSNEELLFELLSRNSLGSAPLVKSFHSPHYEIVVGIGDDDVAYAQIDTTALQALQKLIKESNPGLD